MNHDIRNFARIGFAHFMLYPDCTAVEQPTVRTLSELACRDDIDCIDCCLPMDQELRDLLAPVLRDCGKRIGYAIHPFPLDKISLGSLKDSEQGLIRLLLEDQLHAAASIGAKTFTFASGVDPGEKQRPAALVRFAELCRWLSRRLAHYGMIGLLEPFDRRGYRNFLLGPTRECVELLDSLRPEVDNLRLQLDIAHLRLQEETLAEAIAVCGNYLGHIHLGNCVIRDRSDPFYGDKHPPIGYPAGEIDVAELVEVLRVLLKCGYLNKQSHSTMVIEAQPLPGTSAEQTMSDQLRRLEIAWEKMH